MSVSIASIGAILYIVFICTSLYCIVFLYSYGIVSDVGLSEVYCPTNDYLHLLRCSHKFGQHTCTGDGYVSLKCSKYYNIFI